MTRRKLSTIALSSAPTIVEDKENETYFDEEKGHEEEDELNEDDLFENDDNSTLFRSGERLGKRLAPHAFLDLGV
ncbi:hypothetical protein C4D60_Mb09t19500 [Musa balbisiana]|uniref:Uncharacterized protein n=1 Tax=Musa balbisiana TaxID=52838 RepID=A0A4S8IIY1_MUSBA|nr:hypothetical protein C4D60_Mb09t19500 [Musa balbisiana]